MFEGVTGGLMRLPVCLVRFRFQWWMLCLYLRVHLSRRGAIMDCHKSPGSNVVSEQPSSLSSAELVCSGKIEKKEKPHAGVEPATLRLRVSRSTD